MAGLRRSWMVTLYTLLWQMAFAFLPLAALFLPRVRAWLAGRRTVRVQAPPSGRPVIWMHCASLGEFEQGRPVLDALRAARGDAWLVLSFFSPSGYDRRRDYPAADQVIYLPPDLPARVRDLLDVLRPVLVLWVKYDLWFNHLQAIRQRGIPLLLFAARFRPAHWLFRPWAGPFRAVLAGASRIGVQTAEDRRILAAAGIGQVFLSGDPRADRVLDLPGEPLDEPWLEAFVRGAPGVLVAGSIWDRDAEELARAYQAGALPGWKWILAPHDLQPERVSRYAGMFGAQTLRYTQDQDRDPVSHPVLVLDTIGRLNRVYRLGHIAYVGGGWGRSVHNLLEPAAYGIPVIFGPAHHKFPEGKALLDAGGGVALREPGELTDLLHHFEEALVCRQAGTAARAVVEGLGGGTPLILREALALISPVRDQGPFAR
jgi:3-deoxy-D-manno-octulosonic-acid transferase